MIKKNCAFLVVFFSIFSSYSFAQKNEVSLVVGAITSCDQTVNTAGILCPIGNPNCGQAVLAKIDVGVAVEGAFARQLFRFGNASVDVEFPVLGASGRDLHFGGSPSGTPVSSLFFTPSGSLKFLHTKRAVFSSQLVRAQEPVFTTVCAVMQDPAAFAGQMVKMRATVWSAFEVSTIVDANGPSCDGPWLQYAPNKEKPGPRSNSYDAELQRRHPVFLVEDKNMRRFNDARDAVVYARDNKEIFCGGDPQRYKVTATMTGRLDDAGKDGLGFGHMNAYRVRFVLSSVQDVTTEEIPYDWAEFSREPIRFPHGTIRGRLTDALGRPIKSAWVEAIPAKGEIPISNPKILTNKDGSYSLNVEPGKYFVVVNRTNPASESVPVLTTYFPSVETEGGATTLAVADYAELTEVDIHVRRSLTPRFFEVQVLEPNGKPASGAYAYLTQTNQAPIVGSGVTHANAEGSVRLMGFEGLDYLLWAHLGSWPSERCAQVAHLDPNQTATVPIVMKITLTQADCSKQAQEARSAAYATQKR